MIAPEVGSSQNKWVTDLALVAKYASEKTTANFKFAQFLKSQNSEKIDALVSELSQNVAQGIDCTQCANCCRSLTVAPNYPDIAKLAGACGTETSEFKKKYMKRDEEGDMVFKQRPCPMLKNNLCSVYASRPGTCRTYPHLEKGNFIARLGNVLGNLGVCPIAYNTFEMLKLWFE